VAGVVVYVLVVRLLMLRRNTRGYRELYPRWLDLEKYVYRAVFYTAVPFVLGIISRILDSVVDILVVLLKRTVYSERALPYELPEGNHIGHSIGRSMERLSMVWCSIRKKEYKPRHYEHKIAIVGEDLFENVRIIERSLSFGLLMFCLGLGLTMVYLLVVN
jgi:hydrogenase-4 component B